MNVFYFVRSLQFKKEDGKLRKINNSRAESPDGSLLEMFRQQGNDMQRSSNPEISITRMIPESIKEYFFFDGEKLNNYFGNNSGEKIHNAVFKISQLNLFEEMITHLENRQKFFRRKLNKASPETKSLGERIETLEKSLENYKEDYKNIKWEKNAAEEKEEEYRQKLENANIKMVQEYQKQRNKVESDLERFENEIIEKTYERDEFIRKMTPIIFTYDAIKETRLKIEEKGETGQIPPDYKKEFLERLIEEDICICGTKLSKNQECKNHLESLLQSCSDITNISSELILENKELGIIINKLKKFPGKIADYEKKIDDSEKLRRNSSIELKDLNEKIADVDSKEIDEWDKEYHRCKKLVKDLNQKRN